MTTAPARLAMLSLVTVLALVSGCQATEPPPTAIPTAVSAQAAQVAPTMPDPTDVPLPTQAAVCWFGAVKSLPEDSDFDDYLLLEPAEAGELGVAAVGEGIESLLAEQLDVEGPAGIFNLSGIVTCEVEDVGGCRFDVEQAYVYEDGAELEPLPVEGWEGTIVSTAEGEEIEDGAEVYFELGGDFPVRYGIISADEALQAALVDLAGSDVPIRINGLLTCGTDDTFGTMIVVTEME